jgi:hypothetical protein
MPSPPRSTSSAIAEAGVKVAVLPQRQRHFLAGGARIDMPSANSRRVRLGPSADHAADLIERASGMFIAAPVEKAHRTFRSQR